MTANKSMLGHTLGAAGAIEAIATIQRDARRLRAADHQPRTTPTTAPAGLDLTPNVGGDAATVRAALVNSFGFGGQNTALVFRRWDG